MSVRSYTVEEVRAMSGRRAAKARRSKASPDTPPRCDSFRVATDPVTVRLAFPPMLNHYWRSTVIGGNVSVYLSESGRDYQQYVIDEWPRQAGAVTFDGRLAVRIDAVFPNNLNRDLDGIPKAVLDSLQHAGAFRDDSQVKLLIIQQDRVEKPGWINVTIGMKPGVDAQGKLFECGW